MIVEPIAGNMGLVPPADGFLDALRQLCTAHGAAADLRRGDFRIPCGAGAARRNVSAIVPDLTCLGKIIGGGLPVGAYGGRADLMELVSPAGPVYQAGTLSGNPLAMTAGIWCLDQLKPRLYTQLAALTTRLAAGLADAARQAGVALHVNAFGSLLTPFFTDQPVRDFQSATRADTDRYATILPRHARARRLSAAVTVRSVVPVGGAYRQGRGQDDRRGAGSDERTEAGNLRFQISDLRLASKLPISPLQSEILNLLKSLAKLQRRVQPHPQDRARRQLDVGAFGGRDRSAGADQDAGERALEAAEDAADDRADAGAGADPAGLAADAFALERLGDRGADRIASAVDRDLIECQRQLALPLEAARLVHRADDAAHHRTGRDEHTLAAPQVDHRGRLEPILDLRRLGAERGLQPDVELGAYRDVRIRLAADAGSDGVAT